MLQRLREEVAHLRRCSDCRARLLELLDRMSETAMWLVLDIAAVVAFVDRDPRSSMILLALATLIQRSSRHRDL